MKLTKYRKLIEKKQKNKMTKKQKKTKRNNRNSRKHITKGGNQTVTILGEEEDIENTTLLLLSGKNLTSLPQGIENLTNLGTLDLSDNNLTSLSGEIGNLTKLDYLDLYKNRLEKLPIQIENLKNLQILKLSYNSLNSLPTQIENLKKLQILNLSNNSLNFLPTQIGDLTNLTNLNLSGNQLTTLPPTIEKLSNLKELNLSDNQLATIPENIEKLLNLERLNLVHNNISHPLPSKIGNLTLVHMDGIYQLIEGREECLNFNKEEIKPILNDLNRQIQIKCPELFIDLDYYYKLPGRLYTYGEHTNTDMTLKKIHDYDNFDYYKKKVLILCLYYRGDCISSITLNYQGEETMDIDSYTKTQMERKKYNKLLRCIVIIICSQLSCNGKKIEYIKSSAVNPISAWLLINNFETELDSKRYEELLKEKKEYNELTFQDISNLYQTVPNLMLSIDIQLNPTNVNKAYQLIETLLKDISNSIICPS